MDHLNLKIPPALVFLMCLGLLWLNSRYLPNLLEFDVPYWVTLASLISGVIIALVGVVQFSLHSTTVNPHKPDRASSLVSEGIFSMTRNPMYLGLLLILVAAVLKFGNLLGFFVLPLFVLYMNRFQIKPEERAMERKFGENYRNYKKKVRRWI